MTTVQYPSAALPGPTQYAMDAPEGWVAVLAPEVDLALLAPVVEGHFRSNLVVTQTRVSASFTLAIAAEVSRSQIERLPEVELTDDEVNELDNREVRGRQYAFSDPKAGLSLVQMQMQTIVRVNDEVSDLITFTATTSGTQLELLAQFRSVLASWRATTAPSSVP